MPASSGIVFFKKNISKRVFRTRNGCDCVACNFIYEHGVIVRNISHAEYLADQEENRGVKYFTSKEERDEFVRTQQKTPEQSGA
jgi:hypothetical protein